MQLFKLTELSSNVTFFKSYNFEGTINSSANFVSRDLKQF